MSVPAFRAVRAASVPICAIETADPAATVAGCRRLLNGKDSETPSFLWDIIQGVTPLSAAGKAALGSVCNPLEPSAMTNPAEVLSVFGLKMPEKGILFFSNAQRFITNEAVSQGVWNCREAFKGIGATLVLLAPSLVLPAELQHDAVIISEPLPDGAALEKIITSLTSDAGLADKVGDTGVIVDTLRGLSAFAAEQVLAMSLGPDGIDREGLWSRKAKMIEQTPGLSVWRGGESFDDLGGLANLKRFLTSVLTSGKTPVRAVLFVDEAEKQLSGTGGDTSGTSQDQLGVLLKEMQDKNIPGIILVGPPGTGKSSIAKAAGNVAGAPVIACDLGAMKGSLVGQSEERIRAAMNVFQAVSQGKGIAIATCNKLASLPPELKRRFSLGTFYIDLPTAEEQASIWPMWIKRYGLPAQPLPSCVEWTGSEIRACCDVAYRAGLTLIEAGEYIVPICKSAADQVEALRKSAEGKFISASFPGAYKRAEVQAKGRKIKFAGKGEA